MRPGYKQTEVGVIPKEWEVTPFGSLFAFANGVNADKTAYGTGVRFINVLEPISYSHIYGPEIPGRVEISVSAALTYSVRFGDIVFNRTSETDSELGLAAVFVGDEQVTFGGFVIRGRPIDDTLDPMYSGYALRAKMIRSQIIPMGQGAVRANIGQHNLRRVLTAVPPKAEQRVIATALSDVDALLDGLDRLIAKKRELKQAAMQQLLAGQTRLPGFRGEWEEKTVVDLANVTKGTQLHSNETSDEGQFPHYNGGMFPSAYTDKANTAADTIAISEGGNSCGYVQLIPERFWCGGHCYALVPKTADKRFLYYALKGRQAAIMGLRVGSGLPNVQKTALEAFKVNLPADPAEQAAIAAVLSDMDAELAALEARRNKTRDLKQAMMQELLTGRTRLVRPEHEGAASC